MLTKADVKTLSTTQLLSKLVKQRTKIEGLQGKLAEALADGKLLAETFASQQASLIASFQSDAPAPTKPAKRKKAGKKDGRSAPSAVIPRIVARIVNTAKRNKATLDEARNLALSKVGELASKYGVNADDFGDSVGRSIEKAYGKARKATAKKATKKPTK